MKRKLLASAVAAAAALASVAAGSAADDVSVADLTTTTPVYAEGIVSVEGTLAFSGADTRTDAAGDGQANVGGNDIASITTSQTGDTLRVELRLHDATPAGGVPEISRYAIALPQSNLPGAELHAWTSSAFNAAFGDVGPGEVFTSIDFDGDGGFATQPVDGGLLEGGAGFFWQFTLAEAQLAKGDRLKLDAVTQIGAIGFLKGGTAFDLDTATARFTVGGEVQIAVFEGTGEEQVEVASGIATTNAEGAFSVAAGADLAPGEYTVVVTAEFGDDSDAISTSTLIVE